MAKYMVLWEIDTSRTPEDQKAKKEQYIGFGDMIDKQLKQGIFKDWGVFAGEISGYVIFEGSAEDLHSFTFQWVPFTRFDCREVLTIDQANKITESLPE